MKTRFSWILGVSAALGAAGAIVVACVGDDPVPAQDAAAPTTTPTTTSTTPPPDGALPDTSVPDAATADAAEAGPETFCTKLTPPGANQDLFCADFDGPSRMSANWTIVSPVPNGDLGMGPQFDAGGGLSTAQFASPPRSLTSQAPSAAQFQTAGSPYTMRVTGPNQIRNVTLEMKVNPFPVGGVRPPFNGRQVLAQIKFSTLRYELAYYFGGKPNGTDTYTGYGLEQVQSGGGVARLWVPVTGSPLADRWTTVTMRIPIAPQNNADVVFYDGTSVSKITTVNTTATDVEVAVGLRNTDAPASSIRLDDVVVRVERN
jgi:hypothetical protein